MLLHDGDLDFLDVYCGAGGSSEGLRAAGLVPAVAANHWDVAIRTHALNFPNTRHITADVTNYDWRRVRRTRVAWLSPICTEGSPSGAGGQRKLNQRQLDLLTGDGEPVPQEGFERTRATFWEVLRVAEVHHPDVILVENVTEAATDWALFPVWLSAWEVLGYRYKIVSVSAAHIGAVGNDPAAQWRDRIYVVATRKGVPQPDVEPRPVAWCPSCERDVDSRQAWNPNVHRLGPAAQTRVGKYRRQYRYVCPETACGHATVEPYVRPAASLVDWSDLGQRIGDRRRPLAATTVKRIRAGLAMFGGHGPVGLNVNHSGDNGRPYPLRSRPAVARTTKIGDGFVVPEPFITVLRNNATAETIWNPTATVAAGGNHQWLTVPPDAAIPNRFGLVVPYRKGRTKTTDDPMLTIATRDCAALVIPQEVIEDCLFRMFTWRESMRAQRFPDSYEMYGKPEFRTAQAGNAVPVNVAQWLGVAIRTTLDT